MIIGEIIWSDRAKLKLNIIEALAEIKKKHCALDEEMIDTVVGWLSDMVANQAFEARKFYEETYKDAAKEEDEKT